MIVTSILKESKQKTWSYWDIHAEIENSHVEQFILHNVFKKRKDVTWKMLSETGQIAL